jgi:hypothetical protein
VESPLIAVLGGLGWVRVSDTLGPVVRDCDGRVFSVSDLDEMLTVVPSIPANENLSFWRYGTFPTSEDAFFRLQERNFELVLH